MRKPFRWLVTLVLGLPTAWSPCAFADCTLASTPNDGYFDQGWAGHGCLVFFGDNRDAVATSAIDKIIPVANGGLLLGGEANSGTHAGRWWVGRLTATGAFDASFGDSDNSGLMSECQLLAPAACPAPSGSDSKYDFAVQTDGKVVVLSAFYVTRTNADAHALDTSVGGGAGHVDSSFVIATPMGGTMYPSDFGGLAISSSGQVFVSGYGTPPPSAYHNFGIARLDASLALDGTFHNISVGGLTYAGGAFIDMGVAAESSQVFPAADGRIILAGYNTSHDVLVARINSEGTPDSGFGTNGVVARPAVPIGAINGGTPIRAALVDRVGRTVFVIDGDDFSGHFGPLLTRFDASGKQDTTFGNNGWSFYSSFAACPSGGVYSNALAIDDAGRILVAGRCDTSAAFGVIRVRGDNGALDTSFGINGLSRARFDATSISDSADAIAFDAAGHLFIGGKTHRSGYPVQAAVARLTYDLIHVGDFEAAPRGCLPPNCN
jgi:uncharacterized delta-60 repeat protein